MELAAYLAVCHFNDGAMSIMFSPTGAWNLFQLYSGIKAKKWTVTDSITLAARDPKGAKRRRKQLCHFKKGYNVSLEAREGQQYEAGAF